MAIVPYRHPLHTARAAANIDRFTGGRFVLGVGIGWSEPEYAAVGVPFRERGAMTDGYLAAITAAWTHERVSLDGRYASYHGIATGPAPVQSPHPPIWVGGSSRAALRRAARFGDWHPVNPDLDWLRAVGLPELRAAARELGRDTPALCPRIRARLTTQDLPATDRLVGTGSVAQIVGDLDTLAELGADVVVLDTNPDHPDDRRPSTDDWRTLASIAHHVHTAGQDDRPRTVGARPRGGRR